MWTTKVGQVQKSHAIDHLVGAAEERLRDRQVKGLRGPKIEDERNGCSVIRKVAGRVLHDPDQHIADVERAPEGIRSRLRRRMGRNAEDAAVLAAFVQIGQTSDTARWAV